MAGLLANLEKMATNTNIVAIDYFRKRAAIEKRYQSTMEVFEHQYQANLRMLLSEYNTKCFAAKMLRDGDLLALDDNKSMWMG